VQFPSSHFFVQGVFFASGRCGERVAEHALAPLSIATGWRVLMAVTIASAVPAAASVDASIRIATRMMANELGRGSSVEAQQSAASYRFKTLIGSRVAID